MTFPTRPLPRLRPSPECSPHVPVVVNESDPTTCCCCFTNTNYTTCPHTILQTFSEVLVWKQLNTDIQRLKHIDRRPSESLPSKFSSVPLPGDRNWDRTEGGDRRGEKEMRQHEGRWGEDPLWWVTVTHSELTCQTESKTLQQTAHPVSGWRSVPGQNVETRRDSDPSLTWGRSHLKSAWDRITTTTPGVNRNTMGCSISSSCWLNVNNVLLWRGH